MLAILFCKKVNEQNDLLFFNSVSPKSMSDSFAYPISSRKKDLVGGTLFTFYSSFEQRTQPKPHREMASQKR